MDIPWRVRLLGATGKVCGAGVLLNSRHIVTCAHVVTEAVGGRPGAAPPTEPVRVDFPGRPGLATLEAAVVPHAWCPAADDGRGDIAVLRLSAEVVFAAEPMLVRSADLWGREVRIFGYPGRIDDGVWAEARLLGRGGPGDEWVQVEGVRSTGRRVEQGFSGAGVIDAQSGAILGIVVAEDRLAEAKVAWMLPVDVLIGYWSGLREFVAPSGPNGMSCPRIRQLTDPFALEVHPAIDAGAKAAGLPTLPPYIEREHDTRLRAIVDQAAAGHSAMAILVGGSSTGKTRACWEAVQTLPAHWRLWHPIDPGRAEAAAEAIPMIEPYTVVWLNETHHYLLTPASGLGEHVAAGLRELLRAPDRGPVLVLGTIWPEYWSRLTAPPAPSPDEPDAHAQARALLTDTDIPVPDAFTGVATVALQAAAGADPRLAQAGVHAEHGQVTQFLAGAPALLERYRNATPAAKALLDAAIDARRLGHGVSLPHALLETAASGYLTDQQWDALGEDWFEEALAYTARPCRGARGPLTRIRPRPGQRAADQPQYRLADYLEQAGRAARAAERVPATVWDALLRHGTTVYLTRIAAEAWQRGLYRYAFHLYAAAAEAGNTEALRRAAGLLEVVDRIDEAIRVYRRAGASGDSDALGRVAGLLHEAGRIDEAVAAYRYAAEAGDLGALWRVADLLHQAGRADEAVSAYQRAAEAGDTDALGWVADLLQQAGRVDEAIEWLAARAEAGDTGTLWLAANLLRQAGRVDEAIDWLLARAEAGDTDSRWLAAELLEQAGRVDEAVAALQRAAEAGDPGAAWLAGDLMSRVGPESGAGPTNSGEPHPAEVLRGDEAVEWPPPGDTGVLWPAAAAPVENDRVDEAIATYRRGAETHDTAALRRATELLAPAGRIDEAVGRLQARADAGNHGAAWLAADLLRQAGRVDEAVDWLQARAAWDTGSLWRATDLLRELGRFDEAIGWLQARAEAGDIAALEWVADLLREAGRVDEAIVWLRVRAEAGDATAVEWVADLLREAGRVDEAIVWLRTRAEAGDAAALRGVADLLREAGRVDEAIVWLRARAEAGDAAALRGVADLLQQHGRVDEAIGWLLARAEAGDSEALWLSADLLKESGRSPEAAQLAAYGIEPGGRIAARWDVA